MKPTAFCMVLLGTFGPLGCSDSVDRGDGAADAAPSSDSAISTDLDPGGQDASLVVSPWTYLKAPNNSNSDYFGVSVAMSSNTVVVGAIGEGSKSNGIIHGSDLSGTNDDEPYVGAAYVFSWDAASRWSQQAYLKAPNAAVADDPVLNQEYYGYAVAIDGDTIVVGAYNENSNTTDIINGTDLSAANDSGEDNGAVYVYRRNGVTWTHEAYLKAPNGTKFQRFGYAVAIDGDTIAVGVPAESSSTTAVINGTDLSTANRLGISNGAVYVYRRNGVTWTHEAYLKAPNGAPYDLFGTAVAIDGDTIVVGATGENSSTTAIINGADLSAANDEGDDNGAVYVYRRDGVTWTHEAYLKAPNSSSGDQFGNAVAIDDDTIAVGAMQEASDSTAIIQGDDLSATNDAGHVNGAVYVFARSGTTWTHQAYLKAPRTSVYDAFGQKLSLFHDTIAVGAPGEASSTKQVIEGSDLSAADDAGNSNGAVYLFERAGTAWGFKSYVKSPNNSNLDGFGGSVALDDARVVVGASSEASTTATILYGEDIGSATNDDGTGNGAVYAFTY